MVAEALQLDFTGVEFETPADQRPKLGKRWTPLRYHKIQQDFRVSKKRFNISPAGRRSGKTEIAKRRLVKKALMGIDRFRYIACAPTRDQAKRIFWDDLKALVPQRFVSKKSEVALTIILVNGAKITVMGMDVPERVEGEPIGHILLDEYANMKRECWPEHIRPALSDPNFEGGSADFIGVPEGRNHYWEMWQDAVDKDWGRFHWFSEEILPKEEIEEAKSTLDDRTYRQEYQGEFVTYSGLAYYCWSDESIVAGSYDDELPLILCFDFNREPGVAAIGQLKGDVTHFFDEVYIPTASTTPMVCKVILDKYESHKGRFRIFGDASGGAKGSDSVRGSNWDLVRECFKNKETSFNLKRKNPPQVRRINAMNSRLKNAKGEHRLLVDPKCRYIRRDFEGVSLLPGTNELDKTEPLLTHMTDAIGYMVEYLYPTIIPTTGVRQF